jgi:hypothetical protein
MVITKFLTAEIYMSNKVFEVQLLVAQYLSEVCCLHFHKQQILKKINFRQWAASEKKAHRKSS